MRWFKRKRGTIGALLLLGVLSTLLLLPLMPAAKAEEAAKPDAAPKVEKAKDVYYKTEGIVSGPPAPKLKYPDDYGTYGSFQSRTLVWVASQQHLYFGSFVLAVPMFVFVIELIGKMSADKNLKQRYDDMAHEFMKISLTAYSVTAILGGILIFTFLALYPGFFRYLAGIFRPIMHVYALLFILESGVLYVYYYGWDAMNDDGFWKWVHISISFLLNTIGVILMFFANSWIGFMMSPAGVDEQGRYLGNIWRAVHTALWHPLNVHRILGNAALGGAVVAAYSSYRLLASKNPEERAHYDWMGYTAIFIAVLALIPLPFAGYWLMREVYAYRQQMGITLMGGLLAWVFIMQATMIAVLFVTTNYYLWQAMGRVSGAERYYKFFKLMLLVLIVATISWLTPHTIVMTPAELKAMGGAQHPVVGNYGVMSAKNTAVNIMITTTVLGFCIYQRANRIITAKWALIGNTLMGAIFAGAAVNIVFLGIYGYYIPANVRIGLSVPQVLSTLTTLFICVPINSALLKGSKPYGPIRWGEMNVRGCYAIFMLAVAFTWTMAVMGYIRSSVRLHWHVNEIMRDNSPWAFTNPIGYAGNINSLNVLTFWTMLLFVFWLGSLSAKAKHAPEAAPVGAPEKAAAPGRAH